MLSVSSISELLPVELQTPFLGDSDTTPRLIPVLNEFKNWFDHSGLPFFKSFTDHSAKHSLDVFRSGCEFLSADCLKVVSNKDMALFAAACFCHDAGMHLTESQFLRLVTQKRIYNPSLDSSSWFDLWTQYCSEAKRFGKKRLIQIFGDDAPASPIPKNLNDFTDRHRLLIGDFLRRHHPRLAHDLTAGLDTDLEMPELFKGFDAEERDLVGLISRSHGCSLRSLFPYIEDRYDLRDYKNVHIVFIMCLIGLADYTQLQPSRAPITKMQILGKSGECIEVSRIST